jgi:hypothetical protein
MLYMGSSRVFYVMVLVVLAVLVGRSAGSTPVSTSIIFMICKKKPVNCLQMGFEYAEPLAIKHLLY